LPRADFRSKGDALDPQALVKLLAVMCHPADPRGREGMLRGVAGRIVVPRHQPYSQPATREALPAALRAEFAHHREAGCLAGLLCLALAQLSAAGRQGEVPAVLPVAMALAGDWAKALGADSSLRQAVGLPPRSASQIVAAFAAYRSVSHLWAALVYGGIQQGRDVAPRDQQAVPLFLAYAAEIARLSCSLRWPAADGGLALTAGSLWAFILPHALERQAQAQLFQAPFVLATRSFGIDSGQPLGG